MPDFGGLFEKAKDLAGKHPDQVHSGVEKAEELAEKKLGGQFGEQIEEAGSLIEGFLGVHEHGQAPGPAQGQAPGQPQGQAPQPPPQQQQQQ